MADVIQRLRGQIHARDHRPGPKPLNEIRASPKADLEDLFPTISGKLGKRMNKWLVKVSKGLDFFEISPRKFFRLRYLSVAALRVPEIPHLLLQIHSFASIKKSSYFNEIEKANLCCPGWWKVLQQVVFRHDRSDFEPEIMAKAARRRQSFTKWPSLLRPYLRQGQ